MSDDKREKLLDLVGEFENAMLVTRDRSDDLQARPMHVAALDEDSGTITFTSNVGDEKMDELRAHPSVCVSFQGGARYVSLTGRASINQDRDRIHALFEESWKLWYPEGPDQQDIALIEFEPVIGEYWDTSGSEGLSFALKAAKAYVTGKSMNAHADEHHARTTV